MLSLFAGDVGLSTLYIVDGREKFTPRDEGRDTVEAGLEDLSTGSICWSCKCCSDAAELRY